MIGGKLSCVVAVLFGLANSAFAQIDHATTDSDSIRVVEDSLVRDGEWVLERWETFMGSSTDCRGGFSYQFKEDGQLTIRECIDSRTVTTPATWAIESDGVANLISLSDRAYEIVSVGEDTLVLRRQDEDSGKLVEELELVFLRD
ncbi:MAG: hypothetical protein AAGJ29_09300 [Pseudomonadota bacterium]